MATVNPIETNSTNDDDRNSPHSSDDDNPSDELTKLTISAVNRCDHADTGLHINNIDRKPWLNALPAGEDKLNKDESTNSNGKLNEPQSNDFWMKTACCSCVKRICHPYLRTEETPVPTTRMEKLKYAFLCPPAGLVAEYLSRLLFLFAFWGVIWAIVGSDAEPGGNLFALFILWIVAIIFAKITETCKLPGLLGMLIAGFMLRNVPHIRVAEDVNPSWSSTIRGIALVIILIRAGLGLDPAALKKLSFVCVRLAFMPCLFEAVAVMMVSHFILDFPWLWGLILGFVLAAVSPAVVVPCLLSLQERKFGTAKGIPTLIIASASIDDVLAIGGFGVVLAITFSTGDITMTILQGPIEVLIGIVYGTVIGLILWFLPERSRSNVAVIRSCIVLLTGCFAVLGSRVLDFAGAGPLACLILSFTAALGWRKEDPSCLDSIYSTFAFLWFIFQPFLFALIGAEVSVNVLDLDTIGYGCATLASCLTIRVLVSNVAVLGAGFNWKERLFIAFAWLPKATVQAAIGPVALDYARSKYVDDSNKEIQLGIQILTIAVLSILITAPIGAILIILSGPRLLTHDDTPEIQQATNGNVDVSNTEL